MSKTKKSRSEPDVPSKKAAPEKQRRPKNAVVAPSGGKKPLLFFAVVVVLGAVAFLTRGSWRTPSTEPVRDARLDELAPNLRSFLDEKFEEARKKPKNVEAQKDYVLALVFNELYREAFPNLAHLKSLTPNDPYPPYYEAVCIRAFGDHPRAETILRDVVDRFPNFAPAYNELGQIVMERGEIDQAEKAFEKARDLAPRESEGYAGLGGVALERRDFEKAETLLREALARNPKDKIATYRLGLALRGLGKTQEAERKLAAGSGAAPRRMADEWTKLEGRYSKSVSGITSNAIYLINTGDVKSALHLLEGLHAAHPDDVEVVVNLAAAYEDSGATDRARKLLEDALAKDPNRDWALVNMAAIEINAKNYDKAAEYCDRAIAASPEFAAAYLNRANALARQGKHEQALPFYRDALRYDPRDAKIRGAYASALLALKRPDDARREAERAIEYDPSYVLGRLVLVDILLSKNDRQGAAAAMAAARAVAPNHPEVRKYLSEKFR
jgi:tetratricopeptide (TPR) repeat protein